MFGLFKDKKQEELIYDLCKRVDNLTQQNNRLVTQVNKLHECGEDTYKEVDKRINTLEIKVNKKQVKPYFFN